MKSPADPDSGRIDSTTKTFVRRNDNGDILLDIDT